VAQQLDRRPLVPTAGIHGAGQLGEGAEQVVEVALASLEALGVLGRPAGEVEERRPWVVAGIEPVRGQIGSGALPVDLLPSFALAVTGKGLDRLADAFRRLPIPVIGRIQDETLLFDLRTLDDEAAFANQLPKLAR